MPQHELLKTVAGKLDSLGVSYMLTGSLASSLQGEPRSTHDIDLVVDLSADRIEPLLQAFPASDYFLQRESVVEAVRTRQMFNLLDLESGDKVDFWLLTMEEFDQARFARRTTLELDDVSLSVTTPEDTILMKLKWSEMSGGSEKQVRDARRVFEVQHNLLDREYLERWASELGIVRPKEDLEVFRRLRWFGGK